MLCGETKYMIDLLKLNLDSLSVRMSQSIGGQDFDAYELEALGNCNIGKLTFIGKSFSVNDFKKTVARLKQSKVCEVVLKDCYGCSNDLDSLQEQLDGMNATIINAEIVRDDQS
jgi:hypothetical protein